MKLLRIQQPRRTRWSVSEHPSCLNEGQWEARLRPLPVQSMVIHTSIFGWSDARDQGSRNRHESNPILAMKVDKSNITVFNNYPQGDHYIDW